MSMLVAILILLVTVVPSFLLHLRHPAQASPPTAVEPSVQTVVPSLPGTPPKLEVSSTAVQQDVPESGQLTVPLPPPPTPPTKDGTTPNPSPSTSEASQSESSRTPQSEITTLSSTTEVTSFPSTSESKAGVFDSNGWYSLATHMPAHHGRVGGDITPFAVVVHTTDTIDGKAAIERSWTTTDGNGACAHFIIGRQGQLTQFIPINRNGNHAGGPIHGNWEVAGKVVHPNTVSIGIEIENGGYLGKRKVGGWTHPDTGKILADEDVFIDPRGIGWQRHTPASVATLEHLVDALDLALSVVPPTARLIPDGNYKDNQADGFAVVAPPEWLVGHVTLDPVNKTDPGWQGMAWVKLRAASRLPRA